MDNLNQKNLLAAIRDEEGCTTGQPSRAERCSVGKASDFSHTNPRWGGSPRCARAPTPKSWSDCCRNESARSGEKEGLLSRATCRIPNTLANVRSHSSFTMGPQCPSQVCAARFAATLPQSRNCQSLPGIHHEVVRGASIINRQTSHTFSTLDFISLC